jgi:hypothetical protein
MTDQEFADLLRRLDTLTQCIRPDEVRRRIEAVAAELDSYDRGLIDGLEALIEGIEAAITADQSLDPRTAATITAIAQAGITMIKDGRT